MKITEDKWLSKVMGRKCFVLEEDENENWFNSEINEVLKVLKNRYGNIFCWSKTVKKDKNNNCYFSLINKQYTFCKNINKDAAAYGVIERIYKQDLDKNKTKFINLIKKSFNKDRFFLDPDIDNDIAIKIKVEWLINYLEKDNSYIYADFDIENRLKGFICGRKEKENYRIDLICVSPIFRNRGVAKELINWFEYDAKGFKITVGTQDNNEAAINLYLSMGYSLVDIRYVYHYHGGE